MAPDLNMESVGSNPVRLWGLTMGERVHRLAVSLGLEGDGSGGTIVSNNAVTYDPAWLRHIADNPGMVLTLGGVPVLGHARDASEAAELRAAMAEERAAAVIAAQTVLTYEDGPTIENKQLRKRETPFLMPLTKETISPLERASYFGAYKGVTDVLTKYLWPEWALVLTRIAAKIGMTPNMVTAIGFICVVAATFLFANGQYWLGMGVGLIFMVFDTVDGKLARCTITSSWWGNIFDHGIDLIHPPFWWWFWATGLAVYGLPLSEPMFWAVQFVIQGGYILQRVIEGVFMRQNGMMHIHVWERFDSQFRLITARRNPNMVILFVSMIFARPDIGLIVVAAWTLVSLAVHTVRIFQAQAFRRRGGKITSWLSGDGAA
ncbi:CDP-alcohol phosphatidyltransferase family protein [Altererythrobacter sp. ZODW24]|uniref:CDP-alcohol phosphatidyltransferase family protein n=1 Tax=Altererythrobacter sp. ZODW24 TaxID=2185142 RepID=UPI000DF7FD33|nr:CDP-alcohol phosphatidyltransferase family protein [Altererythrobacter sp. ZODW24]